MPIILKQTLSAGAQADGKDTRQVKDALNRLGYYTPYETAGITQYPDAPLFTAIKKFQKDNNLPVTGTIKPEDSTINALNKAVESAPDGYYIWRSVKDTKARPKHAALDGTMRKWGETPYPGSEPNCRCWGEPVNQTAYLQSSDLHQEVLGSINDAPRKWKTTDFIKHFISGKGESVTLQSTGFLEDIINKSREVVFNRLEKQVAEKASKQNNGIITYSTEASYRALKDVFWVFGGGTVKTRTAGKYTRTGNIIKIDAIVEYEYFDEFTDPGNIRQFYRGYHNVSDLPDNPGTNLELVITDGIIGNVYAITGKWRTKITGSVTIKDKK